jgi:hypothetical protein
MLQNKIFHQSSKINNYKKDRIYLICILLAYMILFMNSGHLFKVGIFCPISLQPLII